MTIPLRRAMEPAGRPPVAAAVAITAAGLIAASPVAAPLPAPQARDVTLTSGSDAGDFLASQLTAQLDANSSLIERLLAANGQLVDLQHQLTPGTAALLGGQVQPDGSVHGLAKDAVEQFFNANNALTGASQASLLGLLGARGTLDGGAFTPLNLENLNKSLLVDPHHTGSIPFAGLESAIGHYIGSAVFLNGFLNNIRSEERRVGKECRSRWS